MEIEISDDLISKLNHFTQQTSLDETIQQILKTWLSQQQTIPKKRSLGSLAGSADIVGDIVNISPENDQLWQVLQ